MTGALADAHVREYYRVGALASPVMAAGGLVPDGVLTAEQQRERWCIGATRIARRQLHPDGEQRARTSEDVHWDLRNALLLADRGGWRTGELTEAQAEKLTAAIVREAERQSADQRHDDGHAPHARAEVLPLESLAEVTARHIEFLAYPYLAKGKINIVFGDAGDGKTELVLSIVANYTTGRPLLPGGDPVTVGNVLLLDAENDPEDTLKPRLLALGGDPDRVVHWNTRKRPLPTIATGFDLIERAVDETNAGILVLDPMQAVIGAEVKTAVANSLRPVLARLSVICERTGCTAIPIMHANKRTEGRALHRLLDSVDFGAVGRSVMLVARDKDDKAKRVFAHAKSNVGPEGDSLGFVIEGGADRGDPPTMEWTGTVDVTADELVAADRIQRGESKIDRCTAWLRELLSTGSKLRQDVIAAGKALGFNEKIIDRRQPPARPQHKPRRRQSGVVPRLIICLYCLYCP